MNEKTNQFLDTAKQNAQKFQRQLFLAVVAFLVAGIQATTIGSNLDTLWTVDFWINALINFSLLSLTYMVFLSEGIEKGHLAESYKKAVQRFGELYDKLVKGNHLTEIEKYAEIRNEEIRRNILRDMLIGSGISLDLYLTKYEFCNISDIENSDTLKDLQKKKLIKIKKTKIVIKKISLNDLIINNNKKKVVNDESFQFNISSSKAKLLTLRLMKFLIISIFFASIMIEANEDFSIVPMVTWMLFKSFALYLAVNSGKKDGQNLITNEKKNSFLKKNAFIERYFEWVTKGKPMLKQYNAKEEEQPEKQTALTPVKEAI